MRLVPKAKVEKIQFFQTHLPRWIENAEALGIDPAVLDELQTLADETRAAYGEQQRAKQRARSATNRLDELVKRLGTLGASVVHGVRANAMQRGNRGAYALASIPAPRKRSRLAPPGAPYGFRQSLGQDGAVTLTWQCKHPRGAVGTTYQVERRDGASALGPYRFLAAVGDRAFRDATIPPGTPAVVYRVQASRGRSKGPVALHTVYFGGGMPDMFVMPTKKLRAVAPPGPPPPPPGRRNAA
jgi:hypothetical protein